MSSSATVCRRLASGWSIGCRCRATSCVACLSIRVAGHSSMLPSVCTHLRMACDTRCRSETGNDPAAAVLRLRAEGVSVLIPPRRRRVPLGHLRRSAYFTAQNTMCAVVERALNAKMPPQTQYIEPAAWVVRRRRPRGYMKYGINGSRADGHLRKARMDVEGSCCESARAWLNVHRDAGDDQSNHDGLDSGVR